MVISCVKQYITNYLLVNTVACYIYFHYYSLQSFIEMPTRVKSKIILLLFAYYHVPKYFSWAFFYNFFVSHFLTSYKTDFTESCAENVILFFITELPPDVIYCCEQYKELIYALINHPAAQKPKSDGKISIAPHPPYGSKQARKVAKERAAQR